MNTYIDGTAASITIDLVDQNGNSVMASAVEYSITDGKGVEKVARTAIAGGDVVTESSTIFAFSTDFELVNPPVFAASNKAIINITPETNTMAPLGDLNDMYVIAAIREARTITLFITTDTGSHVIQQEIYSVERAELLIEGVNSFQSYTESVVNAYSLSEANGWNSANKNQRISAMLMAGRKMRDLVLAFDSFYMKKLNYKMQPAIILSRLGQAEYLGLEDRLKEALVMAQLAEANFILENDEDLALITSGVSSIRIGETQKTFKSTKPIVEPLCRLAMVYLRPYLKTQVDIARG